MYVARFGERYILKRMPETGPKHDPGCDSYEAPYKLSGFGHVAGGAIEENVSLASDRPLASVVLREDGTAPVAMYIVPPAADDAYRAALSELVNESEIAAWIWNASATDMPALPI
jgi:hypothetical protein